MQTFCRPVGALALDSAVHWRMTPRQVAWGFVAFGVVARLLRYLACAPLWIDECLLGENFLDRSYADLLRPLVNDQVAPVGFLWIELTAVKGLGFSEWSLRLFPLCCGIGSLFLFLHLASRLLTGWACALAVGCLAASKAAIGLSNDVKPYASDLLVALVLLILAVEWLRRPERTAWLWALAASAPLALALSLPSVFVLGGVSLALLIPAWQAGPRPRMAWLALNLLLVGAFLATLNLNVSEQFDDKQAFMTAYWAEKDAFPPLGDLWRLPLWLLDVHTGATLFAVPYGSEHGGSVLTFVCCVVAAVAMFRRGQRAVLTAFLGCLALLFVAAAIKRYPYGGHIRLMQFLAPAICLGAGLGVTTLLVHLRTLRARQAGLAGALAALAILILGLVVRYGRQPYEFVDDPAYRAFARALWAERPGMATLCAKTDFQEELRVRQPGEYPVPYAFYRCYQRLYSPSHRRGSNPEARQLAALGRPVRLVVFQPPHMSLDRPMVDAWLNDFRESFDVHGPVTSSVPQTNTWDMYGTFEEYHLIPRSKSATDVLVQGEGGVRH